MNSHGHQVHQQILQRNQQHHNGVGYLIQQREKEARWRGQQPLEYGYPSPEETGGGTRALGGVVVGAGIGAMVGGPVGALVGGVLGGILGGKQRR